jgi:hypothetical protein
MGNSGWIINKKQDSLWFIGSILVSYVFLLLYYGLNNFAQISLAYSSLFIFFLWTIIFDSTHIFATYTRTYFDKDFFQRNQTLMYGMLGVLFIGPAYMVLFYCLGNQEQYRAAFIVFNRFGIMYAYYHLIRQHWGFIALYNRKGNNSSKIQTQLESLLLWSGTVYPFFYHHLYYYVPFGLAESNVDSITYQDWLFVNKTLFVISGLLLGARYLASLSKIRSIITKSSIIFFAASVALSATLYFGLEQCLKTVLFLSGGVFIGSLVTYSGYLIAARKGQTISLQKIILLSSVIITNNFILALDMPYIAAYACITVFHNIQYHAIIRFHNKNKYLTNEKTFGWASKITKNIALFIILALGFNLIFTLPRTASEYITHEFLVCLVASFFWGVGFHHYILDAIIWRPSRDKEVKAHLNIKQTA